MQSKCPRYMPYHIECVENRWILFLVVEMASLAHHRAKALIQLSVLQPTNATNVANRGCMRIDGSACRATDSAAYFARLRTHFGAVGFFYRDIQCVGNLERSPKWHIFASSRALWSLRWQARMSTSALGTNEPHKVGSEAVLAGVENLLAKFRELLFFFLCLSLPLYAPCRPSAI